MTQLNQAFGKGESLFSLKRIHFFMQSELLHLKIKLIPIKD